MASSSHQIALGTDEGLALLAGVAMTIAAKCTSMAAGISRKALGVKLPNNYASEERAKPGTDAWKFNLRQRGAHNALELLPSSLFQLVVTAAVWPRVAAGLGAAWAVGSVLYYVGYSHAPEKRYSYGGVLYRVGDFGLLFASVAAGASLAGLF